MPLAQSQVLVLSNLHHSREPVIDGTNCPKMDIKTLNPSTIAPVASMKYTATQSSPKHQSQQANPWGPIFKNYEAFIDAHTC